MDRYSRVTRFLMVVILWTVLACFIGIVENIPSMILVGLMAATVSLINTVFYYIAKRLCPDKVEH